MPPPSLHAELPGDDPLNDDPMHDFEPREIAFDGIARIVHVAGSGPAVIVMCEMPGISPQLARFARWVRDAGMSVYMPSLFGRDGATPGADEAVAVFRRTCISAEFRGLSDGGTSPVIAWLRQLARLAHDERGGPGVGAVGMCFTGNFALALMLDGPTIAPVLCQPSLPLERPAEIGLPAGDLAAIRERLQRDDLTVLGYRFDGDRWCTAQRFDAYRQALGPHFIAHVLPDSAAHPEPTLQARDQILQFLRGRLLC